MASSRRRRVRRYLLGATQKATGVWWIGQVTVRVMDVSRCRTTRPVRVKAHYGAERSCQTRRRKRGLREGRRRSRDLRRSDSHRQPIPKPPSARLVNHRRRTERWLVTASECFRKDTSAFIKLAKALRDSPGHPEIASAKRRVKLRCLAKWQRLHDTASRCGFPAAMAFDTSFWRYLGKEHPSEEPRLVDRRTMMFSRSVFTYLDPPEEPWDGKVNIVPEFGPPAREPLRKQTRRGGRSSRPVQNNRACRMCGYFGPGPHDWNQCRTPRSSRGRQASHPRVARGLRRGGG